MKTTFKAAKGHVYHVVHETKTGFARVQCWTLCGTHFEQGQRSNRAATCPKCLEVDNPTTLRPDERRVFQTIACKEPWPLGGMPNKARHRLMERDLITIDNQLTRRGEILAHDFHDGAVPLADGRGIIHARLPLADHAKCDRNIHFGAAHQLTVVRYERMREPEIAMMVTCISCLGERHELD